MVKGEVSTPGRRRFLFGGLGAAAVLSLGATLGWVRSRGYRAYPGMLQVFEGAHVDVLVAFAGRLVGCDTGGASEVVPGPEELELGLRMDRLARAFPDDTKRDLRRFVTYLEQVAPLRLGHLGRFTRLSAEAQDGVVSSLERSRDPELLAGYEGTRALVFLTYYSAPATFALTGYAGPLVTVGKGGT